MPHSNILFHVSHQQVPSLTPWLTRKQLEEITVQHILNLASLPNSLPLLPVWPYLSRCRAIHSSFLTLLVVIRKPSEPYHFPAQIRDRPLGKRYWLVHSWHPYPFPSVTPRLTSRKPLEEHAILVVSQGKKDFYDYLHMSPLKIHVRKAGPPKLLYPSYLFGDKGSHYV